MAEPRYDFYQTDTAVNLSVFVRGLSAPDADVTFGEHSLSMKLRPPTGEAQSLELQLFDDIDPVNSSYTLLNSKVDVLLRKKNPGRKWTSLVSVAGGSVPSYETASASASATVPTTTTRARSKWDQLNLDDDDDDDDDQGGKGAAGASGEGKPTGQGGSIDSFFQQLYADADDDTRRAMIKSYQESGGTSLSTNWSEVSKGKVETQPPSGMEAKKWS